MARTPTASVPRTAARAVLLSVAGQVLGVVAAGAFFQVTGLGSGSSAPSWAILVVAGLVPGVANGALLNPGSVRRTIVVEAVAALAVAVVLTATASQAGPGRGLGPVAALLGIATIAVTQTLVAGLIWRRRRP